MLDTRFFAAMLPDAFFINTSGGAVVERRHW